MECGKMARSAFLLITLALLASSTVKADSLLRFAVPASDCACNPALQDPFENPIRFGYGQFAGLCVNTCHFRAVHQLGNSAKHFRFNNLYHDYKYWIADLDNSKIEYADILLERFTVGVDHVMLRLHLAKDSPAILSSQTQANTNTFTNDIILSIEGVPPKGVQGHLWEGMRGSYLLVYRALSLFQIADWAIKKHHHPIRQFRLNIDKNNLEQILERAMRESEKKSFQEAYYLFSENCATNAISLTETPSYLNFEEGFSGPLPLFNTVHALIRKAKIDETTKLLNLEEELGIPL